jgi:hypothetical protein
MINSQHITQPLYRDLVEFVDYVELIMGLLVLSINWGYTMFQDNLYLECLRYHSFGRNGIERIS